METTTLYEEQRSSYRVNFPVGNIGQGSVFHQERWLMKLSVKSVIMNECANYFSCDPSRRSCHWCEARGEKCVVLAKGEPCAYFEKAVLPSWSDVAGDYARMVDRKVKVAA